MPKVTQYHIPATHMFSEMVQNGRDMLQDVSCAVSGETLEEVMLNHGQAMKQQHFIVGKIGKFFL